MSKLICIKPTQVVDSYTLAMQADHECNMARRQAIKLNSKQTFQQLCNRDSPVVAHLFGDNLTEQVSKIKDQAAVKVAVTKPTFRTTFDQWCIHDQPAQPVYRSPPPVSTLCKPVLNKMGTPTKLQPTVKVGLVQLSFPKYVNSSKF